MKKSVTRTIYRREGGLVARSILGSNTMDSISIREIENAFGKVPKGNYRVIYTLSNKGKYLMCKDDGSFPGLDHPGRHGSDLAVCFLPRNWAGMRVNRRVKILPKKRGKS